MDGQVPLLLLGQTGLDGRSLENKYISKLLTMNRPRADSTALGFTYRHSAEGRGNWATTGELEHDEWRKRRGERGVTGEPLR